MPPDGRARAECLSWLFWQMGATPFLGGGFGHFYAYAPTKIEYAIDALWSARSRMWWCARCSSAICRRRPQEGTARAG